MSRMIFVNLPVKDLPRSMEFFRALGFTYNEQFTNDQAAFMNVSDQAAVVGKAGSRRRFHVLARVPGS